MQEIKKQSSNVKATIKYIKKTYKIYTFKLRKIDDENIIEFLNTKENINAYLKKLIIDDMNKIY